MNTDNMTDAEYAAYAADLEAAQASRAAYDAERDDINQRRALNMLGAQRDADRAFHAGASPAVVEAIRAEW